MLDSQTIRSRAEGSVQRMTAAVDMLRQLEEKHTAQGQELAYYIQKIGPMEKAIIQLSSLMDNLLDLIDNGLGEGSNEPLQEVASKASAMFADDLAPDQVPFAHEQTIFNQPTPMDAAVMTPSDDQQAGNGAAVAAVTQPELAAAVVEPTPAPAELQPEPATAALEH